MGHDSKEGKTLCCGGSKMAAPTEEGEGGNPGRSRNPPLLHVISFFSPFLSCRRREEKGEIFCRSLFLFF